MDEGGAEHLMGIGDAAAAMVLHQARGAVDFAGGEIAGAIEGQQVTAVEEDESFQGLAALQADGRRRRKAAAGSRDRRGRGWPASGNRKERARCRRWCGSCRWGRARRWSKASKDGSLSENMAKADIRASAKGISTSPDRGSGRELKRE